MENKQFAKQKCSPPPSTSDCFGAPVSPIYNVETIWGRSDRIEKKKKTEMPRMENKQFVGKSVPPQKYLTSDCCDASLSPIYKVEKVWCGQAGSNKKGVRMGNFVLGGMGEGAEV